VRPVSLPKWPHPIAGTTLPRFGRLVRASAPLLMQLQYKIFIDGNRGLLSAVGGRTVHVINAVLSVCEQKFEQSSASLRPFSCWWLCDGIYGRLDGPFWVPKVMVHGR
jgi:hypothetical protein